MKRSTARASLFVTVACASAGLLGCAALDEPEQSYESVTQALTVDCFGPGDFGRVKYAALQITYSDRADQLVFAVAPNGSGDLLCQLDSDPDGIPDSGDETYVGPTLQFGPVSGILPGQALVSAAFFGVGPCDDPDGNPATEDGREYPVLRPSVTQCDLRQPRPTCPVASEVLNCVEL